MHDPASRQPRRIVRSLIVRSLPRTLLPLARIAATLAAVGAVALPLELTEEQRTTLGDVLHEHLSSALLHHHQHRHGQDPHGHDSQGPGPHDQNQR